MNVLRGVSNLPDAAAAVEALFSAIHQEAISLALFFCSPRYDKAIVAAELRAKFGDINLIGCTTAGEISESGFEKESITAISIAGGEDFIVETSLIESIKSFGATEAQALSEELLERVAGASRNFEHQKMFSFLLIDGLSKAEEQAVSVIHEALVDIPLFGGSAADGLRFEHTFVYYDGEFHENAAILSLFHCELPFHVFKIQNCSPTSKKMVITRAAPCNRVVYEIDGAPAAEQFAEYIGVEESELTPALFSENPVVVKVGGQHYVRAISHRNDDGSLTFYCAIEEGVVLTLAKGTDLVENLETAFAAIREETGEFELVLGCDCIGRRLEVEEKKIQPQLDQVFARNKVIGFSTYGEQFNGMHVNQTLTGVALGKRR